MMSVKTVVLAAVLGAALTFGGCSAQKTEQSVKTEVTKEAAQEAAPEAKEVKSLSIAEGTKNMRDVIKEMKSELNNKEEDKATKTSDNLEGKWKIFEDNVKEKYFTLYEKIEDPLHTINAAVKVSPLDTKTLGTALDSLDNQLQQLELKDLTDVGTQNMRDTLKKMKDQLANKENDNAVKTAENLETNWKKFEDNVKAKSPEIYDKIEDPLHTINAAVKVTPLDTNTLNTAIDKLDAALAALQK